VGRFRGERAWLGGDLLGVAAVLVGHAGTDVADDLVAGPELEDADADLLDHPAMSQPGMTGK
jgi:hypothetical protein